MPPKLKKLKSRLAFSVLITTLLAFTLTQGGCMSKKKQDPYKEGDIVTWKLNDHLILKAEVGERRRHIPLHPPKAEREFYRPQYERYLGQFPIDYQPTRFDKISESEAREMPISKHTGRGYEFNLMLNGSWVQATDNSVNANDTLDHPDQVKVVISTRNNNLYTKEASLIDKQGKYEADMSDKYNLQCHMRDDIGLICFGETKNDQVSGVVFSFWSNDKVKATSYEPIYGGINVEWYFDRKNLEHWQEIDSAIWDWIEIWNVSPSLKVNN